MAKETRLKISQKGKALSIYRPAIEHERLVYIALANKAVQYQIGSSRIVYIGETRNGAFRIGASAADKAATLLAEHGMKRIDIVVVTCSSRQRVKTWEKLETALLIKFRHRHGEIPRFNVQGKNKEWRVVERYFSQEAVEKALSRAEDRGR